MPAVGIEARSLPSQLCPWSKLSIGNFSGLPLRGVPFHFRCCLSVGFNDISVLLPFVLSLEGLTRDYTTAPSGGLRGSCVSAEQPEPSIEDDLPQIISDSTAAVQTPV